MYPWLKNLRKMTICQCKLIEGIFSSCPLFIQYKLILSTTRFIKIRETLFLQIAILQISKIQKCKTIYLNNKKSKHEVIFLIIGHCEVLVFTSLLYFVLASHQILHKTRKLFSFLPHMLS